MAAKDIQQYLEANRGRYPPELLVAELRKAGHSESEIQRALGGPAVYQMPDVSPLTTWGKAWRFIVGFLVGNAISSVLMVATIYIWFFLRNNFNVF